MSISLSVKKCFAHVANIYDRMEIDGIRMQIDQIKNGMLLIPTSPLYGGMTHAVATFSKEEALTIRKDLQRRIATIRQRRIKRIRKHNLAKITP